MRRAVTLLLVLAAIAVAGWFIVPRFRGADDRGQAVTVGAEPAPERAADAPRERATREDAAAEPPPRQMTVRGTVHDFTGKPIAGARVTLCRADPAGRRVEGRGVVAFDRPFAASHTGEYGTYSITADAQGALVVAQHDAFATGVSPVAEEGPTNVELDAGGVREYLIVGPTGEAVAGAEVWAIRQDDWTCGFAATDARGSARISVRMDDFALVRARGFADTTANEPGDAPADQPIRVQLRAGLSVTGYVVDPQGAPIGGVLVTLSRDAVLTGTDGAFRFDGFEAKGEALEEPLGLSATLGNRRGAADVWPGSTGVRVVLVQTATIRGVAVFEDGSPAAGARIRDAVTADDDGRFELTDLETGRQLVWARAASPLDSRAWVDGSEWVEALPGGGVENLRIVLSPPSQTSWIEVRVEDESGVPAAKAHVVVWDGPAKLRETWTTKDGTALVRVASAPGTLVTVAAAGPGGTDARADEPLATRSSPPFERVVLRLGQPGRLRLRLVDPAGQEVPLESGYAKVLQPIALDPDGTWLLPATVQFYATLRVPGFASQVVIYDPPHARVRSETVRLRPACRVVGRVVGPDGEPAPDTMNAVVLVRGSSRASSDAGDAGLDADGRFEMDDLPPGSGWVRIFHINEVVHFGTLEVTPGADVDLGEIRLGDRRALRGVVVDAKGRGLGGAQILVRDPGDHEVCLPACTRPDGTFEFDLPGGFPMALRVMSRGLATQVVRLTGREDQPIRVMLGEAGRVRVSQQFDREPGPRWLEAWIPGAEWSWSPRLLPDVEGGDESGDVYGDLPPGPLDIVLTIAGRERVKRVDVVAGKTADCVFEE